MAEIKDSKLIRDALGSPVPQYWDEASQMYIARTVDGSFADVDFSKVRLLRDKLGSPIPQLWDVETARFVPGKGGGNGEVTIESVPGLRAELDETNATLADTATEVYNDRLFQNINSSNGVSVGAKKTLRPLVTFIDDDGRSEVYDRLKPIFQSKGVPCTIAVISSKVDQPTFMTKKQIEELQSIGWEVASHENTHIAMGEVTDDNVINREIVESKKELLRMGFDVKNIVYPFGQTSQKLIETASKVYRVGTTTPNTANNQTNKVPISNYQLTRVAMGSYADAATLTLEHYKNMVDQAIAENSWLIFMTHVYQQDAAQDSYLAQTIDYIKSKNVNIVNLNEGLEVFGDKLNVDGFLRVTPDNKVVADGLVFGIFDRLIDSASKANDISFIRANYDRNKIIYTKFSFSQGVGMPENTAGTLITNLEIKDNGYVSQIYKIYDKAVSYKRLLKENGSWTSWLPEGSLDLMGVANSISSTSPIASFELGKVTHTSVNSANATGFPKNAAGLLTTNRLISEAGYQSQEYRLYDQNITYTRKWLATGSWSPWEALARKIDTVFLTQTIGLVGAKSTKDTTFAATGAKDIDYVIANPLTALPAGVVWSVRSAADAFIVRVANVTDVDITVPSTTWRFAPIKN